MIAELCLIANLDTATPIWSCSPPMNFGIAYKLFIDKEQIFKDNLTFINESSNGTIDLDESVFKLVSIRDEEWPKASAASVHHDTASGLPDWMMGEEP